MEADGDSVSELVTKRLLEMLTHLKNLKIWKHSQLGLPDPHADNSESFRIMHHKYDISLKNVFYIIDLAAGIFFKNFALWPNLGYKIYPFNSHHIYGAYSLFFFFGRVIYKFRNFGEIVTPPWLVKFPN